MNTTPRTSVLIVEDEGVIAADMECRLLERGYNVTGSASSATQALELARAVKPDIVLMDVRISGHMDGIELAGIFRREFSVPVVFVTAHADAATLTRAKESEPFGFIVKPIGRESLHTNIEVALHRHRCERAIAQQQAWLSALLQASPAALIVMGLDGCIHSMNAAAEVITGATASTVRGRLLPDVIDLRDGTAGKPLGEMVRRSLVDGRTVFPEGAILVRADGRELNVEGEVAPIIVDGSPCGAILTLRDTTLRRWLGECATQEARMEAAMRVCHAAGRRFRWKLNNAPPAATQAGDASGSDAAPVSPEAAASARRLAEEMVAASTPHACATETVDAGALLALAVPEGIPLELFGSLPPVSAHRTRLSEAVRFFTAIAAERCGAGTVRVEARRRWLPLGGRPEAFVQIAILGGDGAPALENGKLFEPFTPANAQDATGLAMARAYSSLAAFGALLFASEGPARMGARFDILLPAATEEARPDSVPFLGAVLLVESDARIAAAIENELETAGIACATATDSAAAAELLRFDPEAFRLVIARDHTTAGAILTNYPGSRVACVPPGASKFEVLAAARGVASAPSELNC